MDTWGLRNRAWYSTHPKVEIFCPYAGTQKTPISRSKSRYRPVAHLSNSILPLTAWTIRYLVEENKNLLEEIYVILAFKLILKIIFKIKCLRNSERLWNTPQVKTRQDWTPVAHYSRCIIQFSSVVQSCPTLFDPMSHSIPGLPVHH